MILANAGHSQQACNKRGGRGGRGPPRFWQIRRRRRAAAARRITTGPPGFLTLGASLGSPLLTCFFETVKKQPWKEKTALLEEGFSTELKNENTKLYCVYREPCKQRTDCTLMTRQVVSMLVWVCWGYFNISRGVMYLQFGRQLSQNINAHWTGLAVCLSFTEIAYQTMEPIIF